MLKNFLNIVILFLLAFSRPTFSIEEKLIKQDTIVYYTPYLEQNPISNITYEDQFAGENSENICYKCILEQTIKKLAHQSQNAKLSINQLSFLIDFYLNGSNNTQKQLKEIINKGQLDFGGGLYTNPDQSTANFQDLLQQIIVGQGFLKENFNYTPSSAAVLGNSESGGYSPTLAYFLKKSSIQGIVLDPLDNDKVLQLSKKKQLEFFWEFPSPKQSEGILAHINTRNSKISPFKKLPEVSMLADKQTYSMAKKFLKYLEDIQMQKSGYNGKLFLEMIDSQTPELEKTKLFYELDELVKLVNKIGDLDGSKFAAQFSSLSNFIQRLNQQGSVYPRANSLSIPRSINQEKGVPVGIFSNSLEWKAIIRYNLELWRNVERLLVIEWVNGKLMNDRQLYKGRVEKIQKDMEKYEKLLLLLQNHELSNNVEKFKEVKSNYMANINVYKEAILPVIFTFQHQKLFRN